MKIALQRPPNEAFWGQKLVATLLLTLGRCAPLWHVQDTQDHSHTPRYTRDMISYPLYIFRLIDRGAQKRERKRTAAPSSSRCCAHGPRHAPNPPPGRARAARRRPGAAQAAQRPYSGRCLTRSGRVANRACHKIDEKATAARPERAAAAAVTAAAMPSVRAVPTAPSAATSAPLAAPERRTQVLSACRQGWLQGGSGRIGRGKWG